MFFFLPVYKNRHASDRRESCSKTQYKAINKSDNLAYSSFASQFFMARVYEMFVVSISGRFNFEICANDRRLRNGSRELGAETAGISSPRHDSLNVEVTFREHIFSLLSVIIEREAYSSKNTRESSELENSPL